MAKIAFKAKYGFFYFQKLSVFQTSTKGYYIIFVDKKDRIR